MDDSEQNLLMKEVSHWSSSSMYVKSPSDVTYNNGTYAIALEINLIIFMWFSHTFAILCNMLTSKILTLISLYFDWWEKNGKKLELIKSE